MLYMYTYPMLIFTAHTYIYYIESYLVTHHVYKLNRARTGFMPVNKTRMTFGNPDQIWQPKWSGVRPNFGSEKRSAQTTFHMTAPPVSPLLYSFVWSPAHPCCSRMTDQNAKQNVVTSGDYLSTTQSIFMSFVVVCPPPSSRDPAPPPSSHDPVPPSRLSLSHDLPLPPHTSSRDHAPAPPRPHHVIMPLPLQTDKGLLHQLVHVDKPILKIPNICIHLAKEMHASFAPNLETDT